MTIRHYIQTRKGASISKVNKARIQAAAAHLKQLADEAKFDLFPEGGPDGTLGGSTDPYGDGSTTDGTGMRQAGHPAGPTMRLITGDVEVR